MTNFIQKHENVLSSLMLIGIWLGLAAVTTALVWFLNVAPGEGTLVGDLAYVAVTFIAVPTGLVTILAFFGFADEIIRPYRR